MNDASRINHVLLQVLNHILWRYLYIPGLYCLLLSALTFALAIQFLRDQDSAGWIITLLNLLVFIFVGFLFHISIALFVGWYTFKDVQFTNAQETQPTSDDTGKRIEKVVQSIATSVPWRYAHLSGVSLFVLAFPIVAYAINLHRMDSHATDWGTVLLLRFSLVLGVAFNVAGLAICAGWYMFKDIDIKDAEGTEQRREGTGSEGGSKTDGTRPSDT